MEQKKKIITIIGARPQIIKASAISRAINQHFSDQLEEIIVHTGQHYDENMSNQFFEELSIPSPKYNLQVGSGSHGTQTGKMLDGLEQLFISEQADAVLVYGDTNSTIAGALAAVKIHIPVIHVEAGLRSFNKAMPEEINRIACDHMSTLLFTPTKTGLNNLKNEGFNVTDKNEKATVDQPAVFYCGDIMYDNSLHFSTLSDEQSNLLSDLKITANDFILCTIHRDGNTDDPTKLGAIFEALLTVQQQSGKAIVLPLHPRTKSKISTISPTTLAQLQANSAIKIIDPVGFLDVIALEKNAACIITDSGGLQKEAYFFQKPCIILRPQTEWIEIVENGNAILADCDKERIIQAYQTLSTKTDFSYPELYGDGKAAAFICQQIIEKL